jgi:uncharacterized protein (DUF4415 family)
MPKAIHYQHPVLKAIHYQHPVLKYHACGLGDSLNIRMVSDIDKVTCKRCLATATAQKRKPGRPLKGDEYTKKISVRLPKSLVDWLDKQGSDRTAALTSVLTQAKNT